MSTWQTDTCHRIKRKINKAATPGNSKSIFLGLNINVWMDTYLTSLFLLQKIVSVYFFSFSCFLADGTNVRRINIFYNDKIHQTDENISPTQ